MRKQSRKRIVESILVFGVLGLLILIPNVKALSFTYNDDVWTYLTVSGPDLTKAGNTESYTVSGKLSVTASGSVHIRFWLDTSSQLSKIVLEEDVLPSGTYGAGYTFTKTYQVFIPADAINNKYIYAKMDTSTRHFSNFGISLVQNPTYSELQSQVASLQSQVSNLQSQVTSLQGQIDTLQTNNTNLQTQVNSLSSQVGSLQSQVSDMNSKNTLSTNLLYVATVLTVVFIATTIYFAVRKPKAKTT
jgi:FtsZ-binding cell division protein ZapB